MSVTASSFLESALRLQRSKSEIDWRNCISRAYYSTFHSAVPVSRFFRSQSGRIRNAGVHEQMIRRFEVKGNPPKVVAMAKMFRDLRKQRSDADYELNLDITTEDAKEAICCAQKICRLLEDLSMPKKYVRRTERQKQNARRAMP